MNSLLLSLSKPTKPRVLRAGRGQHAGERRPTDPPQELVHGRGDGQLAPDEQAVSNSGTNGCRR
jgi:hypothetical protein